MFVLLIGLPLYIAAAIFVVSLFDRPPLWVEFFIYVLLGFLWMLPCKRIFLGVGKADPDKSPADYPHDPAGKYGLNPDDKAE